MEGREIKVRNPYTIRPFQHVLEPLWAYLMIVEQQAWNPKKQGCYNVGPEDSDCVAVGKLADLFCETWDEGVTWKNIYDEGPHEATFLKLDCSLIKGKIGWKPCWGIQKAVEKTVEWAKAYRDDKDLWACMEAQAQELIETKAREKYV